QLYETGGLSSKASAEMITLLSGTPDNADYLASFVDSLLRRRQTSEAQIWMRKLQDLQPNHPETTALRARLLAGQGRGPDAIALLHSCVTDKSAGQSLLHRLRWTSARLA